MQDKLKKFLNSKAMPFIILFLAMLCINIFKSVTYGDDTWFARITTGEVTEEVTSITSYFNWRYKTWSSRLIVEFFLIIFAKNFGILWKVLDARNFCAFSLFNYKSIL